MSRIKTYRCSQDQYKGESTKDPKIVDVENIPHQLIQIKLIKLIKPLEAFMDMK